MHLVEHVHGEVDGGAGLGEGQVLADHGLDLLHDLVGLGHLAADLARLRLERLQAADDRVVVEDLALGVVERLEQVLLEVPEPHLELALHAQQVQALLLHVRPLALEHLVQALRLQAGPGHREVDEGDTRADVGRELDGGVARGQEHGEHGREVDVLVAERDEDAAARAPDLAVQHRVEDGVVVLDVLDEDGVAEAQRRLQVLAERVVEEGGLGYLAVFVRVHDELGGLARRVDHQRVAVEPLQHDRVLDAQVVGGQGRAGPQHPLVRAAQVLDARQVVLAPFCDSCQDCFMGLRI